MFPGRNCVGEINQLVLIWKNLLQIFHYYEDGSTENTFLLIDIRSRYLRIQVCTFTEMAVDG